MVAPIPDGTVPTTQGWGWARQGCRKLIAFVGKFEHLTAQRPGAIIILDTGSDRARSLAIKLVVLTECTVLYCTVLYIKLLVLTEWSPASKISMACISLPVERMNVVWHAWCR